MSIELQAPKKLPKAVKSFTKVFMAGSIEMGKAEKWQDKLVSRFENENEDDVIFLNPRRDDWDSSWAQDPNPGTQFHEQVSWELEYIEMADVVVFYFDPKTQSPITLLELGLTIGRDEQNIIVCCPDGYFRKGNVVITCDLIDVPVLNTFEELVEELEYVLFELK